MIRDLYRYFLMKSPKVVERRYYYILALTYDEAVLDEKPELKRGYRIWKFFNKNKYRVQQ